MNPAYLVIAAVFATGTAGCSDGLRLNELGHPFKNESLAVNWAVPTNAIPEFLSVFKVSPAQWNQGFLSNVIAIGDFKDPARSFKALRPAMRGSDARYTDEALQGARTSIILNPSIGRVLYYREGVVALPTQPVQGVPSEEEALRLALEFFSKLELPTAELRRRPGTQNVYYTRDVTTRSTYGSREKKVIARGLYLVRGIDGFGVDGVGTCGGMSIRYGNHGQIAEMELVWPRVHSPSSVPVAQTNQILSRIREGKATIATDYEPREIRSLTITNATIWYFGSKGPPVQRSMEPFLSLDGIAKVREQHVPVRVNCPIIR